MSQPTPTPELVALLALSERATPGVWCAFLQGTTGPVVDDAIHAEPSQCCNGGGDIVCNEPGEEGYPASQKYWEANAQFICALVNWFRSTRAATVPQGVVESDGFAVRYPDGSIEVTSIRKSEHASQWAQGFWPKMAAQGFTCVPVKITVATPPPAELGKGS